MNISPWINEVIDNNNPSAFPYYYASTKSKGIRFSDSYYPNQQLTNPPWLDVKSITGPVYVLNIPFFASESETSAHNEQMIRNLVKKIFAESFFDIQNFEESKANAAKRVFLVLGVNRPYSLDADKNNEFIEWIRNFPKLEGIQTFVAGKFWHPKIIDSTCKKIAGGKREIAFENKAVEGFSILKNLNPMRAAAVKTHVTSQKYLKIKNGIKSEGKKSRIQAQIPYQQIRNWVLQETFSQPWLQLIFNEKLPPLVYLGFMDGDTHSLCGYENVGLLKTYDSLVLSEKKLPMLMSTGYFLPQNTDQVSLLANLIDMAQRQAIADYFPTGVYFPEPNLFLLLNELWAHKNKISFLRGQGNDTESRRLIENLIGYLDIERVVFVANRTLVTTPPKRLLATPIKTKSVINDFSNGFEVKDLSKAFFGSLRGVSQTHFDPSIWASNMYIGLKSYGAITVKISHFSKIHAPLTRISTVFDFPNFFEKMGFEDSLKKGQKVDFTPYKTYVAKLLELSTVIVKNQACKVQSISGVKDQFIESNIIVLKNDCQKLAALKISEAFQVHIMKAAAASGEIVYEILARDVRGFQ